MKRILFLLLVACAPLFSFAQTSTLFISEIAEGSSNNKYLEIYNGTGVDVDLSLFSLSTCSNGCDVFNQFDFPDNIIFAPGTILANGDVYVIAHPSADPSILAIADMTFSFLSNGDDAYALTLAGATASVYTIIDLVGDMQGDPGSGWAVAGVNPGTQNHTLVRKYNICQGNPNELGSFGTDSLSSEWIVYPSNYWDSLNTHYNNCVMSGCDTYGSTVQIVCGSYTSPSGNYIFSTSGNYLDTIPNAAGCDSIIAIDLTVHPVYNETATASICTGNSYIFGTQTLTATGQYTELFTTIDGCDSTVVLDLTVVASYTTDTTATICDGDFYTLGTQTLTTSGTYSELFVASGGCDSTVNLILTVIPNSINTINEVACSSYTTPSGTVLTTSGSYNDTIPNSLGCDSVIIINLTINQPTTSTLNEASCGSFDLNGTTYTSSGTYTQVIPNANGCDSTITLVLDITPIPSTPVASGSNTYCENETISDLTVVSTSTTDSLIISGVADCTLPGGLPKYIEFYALHDIADLSNYGFGSANNGGGSDGVEYIFPAQPLAAGSFFKVATDSTNVFTFFGFYPDVNAGSAANINGDDAIELFKNVATTPVVIDVFGDINTDGTGQPWEYLDGWAYRNTNSVPNGGVFNISEWSFSGPNALDGASDNASSGNPVPVLSFSYTAPTSTFNWYTDSGLTNLVGTGATYSPSTTSTQLYYVTETFTGGSICTSNYATAYVEILPLPTVTFGILDTICDDAGPITLTQGSPANGIYSGTGVNHPIFDPAVAGMGTYTLTYTFTDTSGCVNTATSEITVEGCSGIEDLFAQSVRLYPNPSNEQFAIRFEQAEATIVILDLNGSFIASHKVVSNQMVDVSTLNAGTYFVQITIDNHTFTKRLTIH